VPSPVPKPAFLKNAKYLTPVRALLLAFCALGVLTFYLNETGKGKSPDAQADAMHAPALSGDMPNNLPENFILHPQPRPLQAMSFTLADGRTTGLEAFAGEIVVLNFWATWCAPCRKEMPQLDALQAHFADSPVRVVALSLDRGKIDRPAKFLAELGIAHLTHAHDGSYKSARNAGLIGLPTTLVIDAKGHEIGRLAGEADWNAPSVQRLIANLLDAQRVATGASPL
jgi:thiol-disulfide isomerase/thioredoxin